jgi:hypothetical protein
MPSSAFEGLEHTCYICKDWIPADELSIWNEGPGAIWFVHVRCNPLTKHEEPANLVSYPRKAIT